MKPLLKLTLCLLLLTACNESPSVIKNPVMPPLAKEADTALQSGTNPYAPVDVSPMDISYFPADYPVAKMTHPQLGLPMARVIYSRPHKQGRTIFGALLKWGERWRLGANEATELELFRDATIQNKKVAKGRYVLYCVPQPGSWTIVFNTNLYSWGLKQDTTHDVYAFQIPATKTTAPLEYFTMVFQKSGAGADLLMAWDDVTARLPFAF